MDNDSIDAIGRVLGLPDEVKARLVVTPNDASLKVVSFEKDVGLDPLDPLVVELENGKFATLMDNVPHGPGTYISQDRTIHSEGVWPNIVLTGSEPWPNGAVVRWATFGFKHSEVALLNRDAIKTELNRDSQSRTLRIEIERGKNELFSVILEDLAISVRMYADHSGGSLEQRLTLNPVIEVEFKSGASLHEYVVIIQTIVRCFALSIGCSSHPTNLLIHYDDAGSQIQKSKTYDFKGLFRTHYRWNASEALDEARVWVGHSVLQVREPIEKEATAATLTRWMERRHTWRAAYSRMSSALELQDKIDRDRLLNAFSWFEAIPFTAGTPDFSSAQLSSIRKAAAEAISASPDSLQAKRINSVVALLGRESLPARLRRLINALRERFGDELVLATTEEHCLAGVELRNAASHGEINWDENSLDSVFPTIYALEAVCFLLTIYDLPTSENAASRIGGHPLMQYLRWNVGM